MFASRPRLFTGIISGALTAAVILGQSAIASAQDFYKGKTLTFVVGSPPGGGFDLNTRILARHIGRHIPGQPDAIVSNMLGAGSLTALRYMEQVAPKDGTVSVSFNFGLIGVSKLTPDKAPVDFRKYGWIGSISQDLTTCYVWHEVGPKTMAELKARKGLHFGLASVGGNEDINAKILKNVFKVDINQVGGYPGSAAQRLAIQRRELDGGCGSWNSLPEEWVRNKWVNPVYRTGETPAPDMPAGVPWVLDIAPSDRDRAIINLLVSHNELGRPYVVSPAVPAERQEMLRRAFQATMKDAQFIAELEKARMPLSPRSAEEALKIIEAIYASPDDIVEAARTAAGG